MTSHPATPAEGAGQPPLEGAPTAPRAFPAAATAVLVTVAVVAFVLSVSVGSVGVVVPWAAFDPDHGSYAVAAARIERTVTGCCVGAALALAGALLQGLTRNPLADPELLGITAGATLSMVLAVAVWSVETLSACLWYSLLGAAIAAIGVHLLASLDWKPGSRKPGSPRCHTTSGGESTAFSLRPTIWGRTMSSWWSWSGSRGIPAAGAADSNGPAVTRQ